MLELMICSLVTILPDYLYRRYAQGRRFGHEITFFSVWYELRWGITGCLMLTTQAAGRELTTVEGLAPDDPVPAAFVEARAFQCGYCTPGMVLAASSLLRELARPSDDEIAEALGGNLCRCGCYVKITEAVRRAAA